MATEKITSIMEEIKTLTILEMKDLVKALEEEFGVSAAPSPSPPLEPQRPPQRRKPSLTLCSRLPVRRSSMLSRLSAN